MVDVATLAQVAQTATAAASDLASTVDASHLVPGATVAVLTAELIQMAKTSRAPLLRWVSENSQGANRLLGGVVAFLTGLGLSFHFDHATGTLVINGLVASSITHGVMQWVQQQLYYRLVLARGVEQVVQTSAAASVAVSTHEVADVVTGKA